MPFAFATNPPTPFVAAEAKRTGKQSTRPADVSCQTLPIPCSLSLTSFLPQTTSPTRNNRHRSASAPIHTAETPVQKRNIAFRAGELGTPGGGGGGGSARRSSVKGSGRRGSSIGGGFEGVFLFSLSLSLFSAGTGRGVS